MPETETSPDRIQKIVDQYRNDFPRNLKEATARIHLGVASTRNLASYEIGTLTKEADNCSVHFWDKADKPWQQYIIGRGIGYLTQDLKDWRDLGYNKISICLDEDDRLTKTDLKALQYADEFFMPEEEFMRRSIMMRSITKVAKYFRMPEEAVYMRSVRLHRGYDL